MKYDTKKFTHHRIRKDDNAGASGGGGGAPASTPTSSPAPTAAPAPSSSPSSTPTSTPSRGRADYGPAPRYEAGHADRVAGILAKENDPSHSLTLDETRDLLSFPTVFKSWRDDGEVADPAVPPAANAAPVAPVAPAAPAAPAVDPNAPPKLDPNVEAIINALGGVVNAPKQPANPAEPTKPRNYYGDVVPPVAVDPQLTSAIFNAENPQQAHEALNYLVNGMLNRVMEDTGRRMMAMAKQIMTAQPQIAQQQVTATNNTQRFYSKFAELNRDAFKPVVAEIEKAMVADARKTGRPIYDDKFIEDLGNAAHTFLEQTLGVSFRPKTAAAPAPVRQAAQPAPAAQTPGKFFTPGGSRAEAAIPTARAGDWRDLVI